MSFKDYQDSSIKDGVLFYKNNPIAHIKSELVTHHHLNKSELKTKYTVSPHEDSNSKWNPREAYNERNAVSQAIIQHILNHNL